MEKLILIVDDSESMREVIAFTLESQGFTVIKSTDGKNAQNYLDNRVIDLIITDLNMPEMNGIQLIKTIRTKEAYQHTPILFLTTESHVDLKQEAKKAGATGWIMKPFVPQKLIEVVNKVMR